MPSTELLIDLNYYLEAVGIYNPYHKIYITTGKQKSIYSTIFLFYIVLSQLPKIRHPYLVNWTTTTSEDDEIDGRPFVIGVSTIFRQFHRDIFHFYIDRMCHYIMAYVNFYLRNDAQEIRSEAGRGLSWIQLMCDTMDVSRDVLAEFIPECQQNQFVYLSKKLADTTYTPDEIGLWPIDRK